jgi:hypothetical protein
MQSSGSCFSKKLLFTELGVCVHMCVYVYVCEREREKVLFDLTVIIQHIILHFRPSDWVWTELTD